MADAHGPFDDFQPYYDLMVNWEDRLALEAPFFQRVFSRARARRVLDCACGTGHHVRLFARWGLEVAGSDLSPAMVEQARRDTRAAGAQIEFEVLDFTKIAEHFSEPFDAVICTGNSLPLAGSAERVKTALQDMHEILVPGGVAVIQTLNFERLPEGENVYREPRVSRVDNREILFLKVLRKSPRICDIDIVVLEKQAGEWKKLVNHARAWTLSKPELEELATDIGFGQLQWYGGYEPKPFNPRTSDDLILVAHKEK
jgi:SAM-dependent methyltransferase